MNSNSGRPRHPPGLKGRSIGLFYKNQQAKKNPKEKRIVYGSSVALPERTFSEINTLLAKYQAETNPEDIQVSGEFQQRFYELLHNDFNEFVKSKNCDELKSRNNPFLNDKLIHELEIKKSTEEYKRRLRSRIALPATHQKQAILDAIDRNQIILLVGSTGCGKTTQIPQFILDHYIETKKGSICQIVCSQPRRISAITVAERVAYERNESLGHAVGYQIRLQGVSPRPNGSILYCTTGTLLRRMESDPLLFGLSHIILDEIHERTVETDMLMGLLKKVLPYRDDLKVILMSATVSQSHFQKYFHQCFTMEIRGTLFEVEDKYLEDVLEETGFRKFTNFNKPTNRNRRFGNMNEKALEYQSQIEPYIRIIRHDYDSHVIDSLRNPDSECINIDLIEDLVFYICERKPPGAILVFLPGYDKISKLNAALLNSKHFRSHNYNIYTLHSSMPTMDQKSVFMQPPEGVRKIILSTNIAESSVTIDDVVYVINSGKMMCNNYDVELNMQTLEEKWISVANAHQRRGRAGRVQRGICYNLYTKARERLMDAIPTPEIVRSKLEGVLLNLKLLHIHDVAGFMRTLLDCPKERAIENGIHLLKRIEALDEKEVITPLGMHLARLPIDPQMGKMILMGALFRCLDPITTVAAAVAYKDPFYRPLGKEQLVNAAKKRLCVDTKSDHLLIVNVMVSFRGEQDYNGGKNFCYQNFLSYSTLAQLERMKGQFCKLLQSTSFAESDDPCDESSNVNSSNSTLLRAIITAGLYPNIAHLRNVRQIKNRVQPVHKMCTPTDRRVKFHPSSVNYTERSFDSHYFAYFLKQKTSEVYLMDTTMIFPMALIIFGDGIKYDVDRNGGHFLSVADFFFFKSNFESNRLIMQLRQSLGLLLQKKALHPSPIEFNSKDESLINAIKILLSHDVEIVDSDTEYLDDNDD